jgi:hypothetical protein
VDRADCDTLVLQKEQQRLMDFGYQLSAISGQLSGKQPEAVFAADS